MAQEMILSVKPSTSVAGGAMRGVKAQSEPTDLPPESCKKGHWLADIASMRAHVAGTNCDRV
jgi:hypothetical protein